MDQTSGGIKRKHWEEILDREMLIIFLLSREAVSKEEYLFLKRKLDFVNHFKKTVLGKPVKEQKQSFIKKRLKEWFAGLSGNYYIGILKTHLSC